QLHEFKLSRVDVDTATAQFDLLLFLEEDERGLQGSFEYSTDLFDETTITRMADHFSTLLKGIAEDADQLVSMLPLLTAPERRQLLVEWNRTTTAFPTGHCLHHLFEVQVKETPDAIALVSDAEQLTYRELNDRANELSLRLRRLGVGAEVLVGLCTERSSEMVVGMLGILKTGGAYLPLDPAYPKDRVAFMLTDGGVRVLLTQQSLLEKLPPIQAQVICLDQPAPAVEDVVDLPTSVDPDNLAYVIYTSGSTGRPKGVAIQHHSAVTLMYWAKSVFSAQELAGVLASTSICFDLSVFEILVPLSWGGKVILAENALQLPALRAAAEVRLVNTVPSAMSELLKMNAVPASVRTVNLAGEPLRSALAQQILSETGAEKLYNLYGPSEDTTYSTFARISQDSDYRSTIGRPIANTEAYILDRHLNSVPIGVSGELYLTGEGLARGYLNRPEISAAQFIPDPFSLLPGQRLYKTGDFARYLPDGNIDFLGRGDSQVKLRGFRIELGEIQSVLLTHPAVKDAVLKVYGEDSDQQLVAYVVGRQSDAVPRPNELREFLREKLPDFMTPSAFIALEKMPLTPNGKIDRSALPPPERADAQERIFVAPRNETEELVASIWSNILGIENISVFDNFFELGGHSLLATRVVFRIREALQVDLPLRTMFLSLTIAELAQKIDNLRAGQSRRQVEHIRPVERTQPLPLSFAQQRLWLLHQIEPASPFYNMCGGVRLKGPLNFAALQQSLNEITRRHEILRTAFVSTDDQAWQSISSQSFLQLPIVDLRQLSEFEREAEISRLVRREARRPFDLQKPSLVRFSLIRASEEEHILLLTAHHIVFDAWSIDLFIRELGSLFDAFSTGRPSPLPKLPIQFADYAVWQKKWLSGETLEKQRAYWTKQLGGKLPVLELPSDHPRPPVQTFNGARQRIFLSQELTASLRSFSNKNGTALFSTLLAAFNVLLYRYSGQDDILVGCPIANRNRSETEGLIGFFVNTIVMRTDLSGQPTLEELLERVRRTTLEAYANQDMPFEKLVEELQPDRDLSRTPLYQVMLSLREDLSTALELPGMSLTQFEADTGASKFDLSLQLEESAERVSGWFEYNTDLFDAGRISRMAAHFEHLLEAIVTGPSQPISRLSLLTPVEQTQMLLDWNDTYAPFQTQVCVHEMFEAQAEQIPNALALATDAARLTFAELNEKANRLAQRLRTAGVGPEVLVAVYIERSAEMVIALLAILKAGGAYLPLDPADPEEVSIFKLEDASVRLLLTTHQRENSIPRYRTAVLFVDDIDDDLAGHENPVSDVTPENLAYVIYTSGSTG
ncbi:MAG TPA: amino acid adenylation domain-containing protein, partial [Pyrinomonadaceae bacterium]|nr:amino acid adenylation domain-containing protein [Pyrinomonadaceae bacterium]